MASFKHKISLVLLSFLCIYIASSSASDLTKEICPQTRNATLCFDILGRRQNATLHDLGRIAAESAMEAGFLAWDQIQLLIKTRQYPKFLETLRSCLLNYGRANIGVGDANDAIKSSSYKSLPSIASAILAETAACDKNFVSVIEPVELIKPAKYFEDVCSVLLIISNKLASQ